MLPGDAGFKSRHPELCVQTECPELHTQTECPRPVPAVPNARNRTPLILCVCGQLDKNLLIGICIFEHLKQKQHRFLWRFLQ